MKKSTQAIEKQLPTRDILQSWTRDMIVKIIAHLLVTMSQSQVTENQTAICREDEGDWSLIVGGNFLSAQMQPPQMAPRC